MKKLLLISVLIGMYIIGFLGVGFLLMPPLMVITGKVNPGLGFLYFSIACIFEAFLVLMAYRILKELEPRE